MREVVPKDELDKMAKMSKSPARQAWKHQMHRKGAIRRIMGKMPRQKDIVQLLAHDDATYDSNLLKAPAEGAPTHKDIFGGRPVRQKRGRQTAAIEHTSVAPMDMVDGERERELVPSEDDIADERREVQQIIDDDEDRHEPLPADEPAFILHAIITTKNGVQQFPPAQAEFWFGDIQQKMKALEGDPLRAFWKANEGFINEAGRNGYAPYAMKLLEQATDLGLIAGGDR